MHSKPASAPSGWVKCSGPGSQQLGWVLQAGHSEAHLQWDEVRPDLGVTKVGAHYGFKVFTTIQVSSVMDPHLASVP